MTIEKGQKIPAEERFQTFFEAAFEGIGITDGGVVVDVNDRLAGMLGYDRDEIIGRPVMDFVVEEDRERVTSTIREGHATLYSHRSLRKDGTSFPVEARGRTMEVGGRTLRVTAIRDISESEEADIRFRESEERFRSLFDAAPDAYFVQDQEGRILEANKEAEVQLGYSKEELVGKTFGELNLVPPEFEPAADLIFRSPLEGNSTGPGELQIQRKDGRRIWVEGQASPVRIKGEELTLSVARDVTLQRQVSERLSILTKAVESSRDVVFLTDLDGVFTFVNSAFTEVYGWKAQEVVGIETPRVLKSGFFGEDYYAEMWSVLQDGRVFEGEFKNRTRSGGLVDIASAANPVRNDEGEIIGFLAIQSDISARKLQEETLLNIARGVSGSTGETFFRDLAHHLCLAVGADVAIVGRVTGETGEKVETVAVEVDGDVRGNFTYPLMGSPCAKALSEGVCIEPSRVQEKFPLDLGLQRFGANAYVGKALLDSDGEAMGVALVLFRQQVSDPTLAVSMLEIFAARAVVEMERSRAETERRTLEAQLRQAQKMEEIGQLTGGIAHDFQNLLSVILLNTELMKESVMGGEPITVAEVEEVEAAAQQAANMTRKLLGFGRRADLSMVPTELGPVVTGMSSMLRRVIPEDIEVSIQVEEALGRVKADPGAVEQILLNLATNARDAMPGGGSLTVELRGETLGPEDVVRMPGGSEGDYLRLTISDTGVGMDEQVKSRVFEPFFTTKPVGEGTGLGLAMAFGLAQQHGGFLQLESEVGIGTAVSLFLPLATQIAPEASPGQARGTAEGGEETLLVVEDQAALRRTLKLVLERVGYQVILAEDGQEGLELALVHGTGIDLIISDLVMPRMGGVELFQTLRQRGMRTPFIMASGYAGKSASGLAELDPSVPVLKKPWKPGDLLHRVREVLDRE